MLLYSQEVNGDCTSNEEDLIIVFFMELNNRIFQILSEVAGSAEPILTAEHVRAMGLDPQGDRCWRWEHGEDKAGRRPAKKRGGYEPADGTCRGHDTGRGGAYAKTIQESYQGCPYQLLHSRPGWEAFTSLTTFPPEAFCSALAGYCWWIRYLQMAGLGKLATRRHLLVSRCVSHLPGSPLDSAAFVDLDLTPAFGPRRLAPAPDLLPVPGSPSLPCSFWTSAPISTRTFDTTC
ncbi:uncharacterized protein LOC133562852 [Nerophis ophidion]|uniref:uncharacterized protein LOC133562852 n=1 Tax=Nerophis ophidion TaxID=159077 RepID=UPI002ADF9A2A|nr:uncharacterized protein LOC133562852 [Nerophis ophidion]